MSDTPIQPNATPTPLPAPGDATNPNATATSLTTPQANATPAPASGAQPSDNSNVPDADTKAGNSIPQNLINNPGAPTQKMATLADLNKTSPAPQHAALYNAAIEMTGGQRYTTSVDAAGNTVRKPIEPKPWALGLALALNVLQGGLQGMGAKNVGDAAQAGAASADKQRAAVKQANANQDAQAIGDQEEQDGCD